MGRGKKIALGVLAAVVVAVVGVGTASAVYLHSIDDRLTKGDKTDEEIEAIKDVLPPTKNFNEPFYMMLVGSDRRVGDDAMGARSDTNIVVRVDPTQNLVTMVSIPRDTKIDIDGHGTNKFNAAYNYDGVAGTIKEADQLLDIDISSYAEINFDELIQLVDSIGGVDVMVDERIDDTDADGSTGNPNAKRIIIEEGEQHLDGESALVFARSRAYVDGDFTRTANQRKLIQAIVDKVLALPISDLPGVIQSAAQCVTTNLSVADILSLAQQFKEGGNLTLYSAMVPSTTADIGGVSYVLTDEPALEEMMRVVEEGGDPSGITASSSGTYGSSGSGDPGGGSTYYDGSGSSGPGGGSTYSGSGGYDDSGYYSTYGDAA